MSQNYFEQILGGDDAEVIDHFQEKNPNEVLVFGPNGKSVRARTANQKKLVQEAEKNDIVFAIGPAGTGKTYTAVALAVRALKNKQVKKIILTRPAVEAGESLGFLPGDLKEKIDPYLRPLYDALDDMIPADKLGYYMTTRTIEIAPLAYMRGRTLDNAYIILDEAQNATELQLKMFLTRIGANAKAIITGDMTQVDLPRNQRSGLKMATRILKGIEGIAHIELDEEDVVRHRLVKAIIKAYNREHEKEAQELENRQAPAIVKKDKDKPGEQPLKISYFAGMKIQRLIYGFLFLLFFVPACKEKDRETPAESENNIDAARNFIRSALDGKFTEARRFLLPDSLNVNYMDVAERSYQRTDLETRNGYRAASINIIQVNEPLKDSVTIVIFSNSFKNDPDTLKLVKMNNQWLVDLKYLYQHETAVPDSSQIKNK